MNVMIENVQAALICQSASLADSFLADLSAAQCDEMLARLAMLAEMTRIAQVLVSGHVA